MTIGHGAPLVMGVVNASPDSFSDGAEAATLRREPAGSGPFHRL
jgi:dihydropteroate synthase